jgi:SMP-30/Gluconolactonase/LRE-like region
MTRSLLALLLFPALAVAQTDGKYVKKSSRADTAVATLASFGLPTLEGKWYFAGPFDNTGKVGFDAAYPPEKGVDLKAQFVGKGAEKFGWQEFKRFRLGQVLDLRPLCPSHTTDAVVYLFLEFESKSAVKLPVSLGSDDTLSLFFNGTRIFHEPYERGAAPDQDHVTLDVKAGKNQLLLKVGQLGTDWAVYVAPTLPGSLPAPVLKQFDKDFPGGAGSRKTDVSAEAKYYPVTTYPLPKDCALEVGGLAFRPDGKLLVCTRRGEIWLVQSPESTKPSDSQFSKYAGGLHEALGMWVKDDKTVYVVQRPELTIVSDTKGTNKADGFETFCDKWGVSGDYHEYAFGPARDPKTGDFFITLNVGFGGGHQSKAPWRGWVVKVDGKTGDLEPWAYGVRSPNGINFSPDGDLFYTDNQGEWVASNKMHHIKKGKFYGHQAGLRWVSQSPFAGKVKESITSGMLYDGQPAPGKTSPKGMPDLDPPSVWFPYGRMGQSIAEPIWDTTGGKFGPFAGQCFVADQYTAIVMRVAMEKVNGVYQGACFPFRRGLQCGVNRLAFGPDGALYCGETNRGWGSLGGKPYGLERINFAGIPPMEVHHVKLTKDGFDFVFTHPVDAATINAEAFAVKSFTYVYFSTYGCPETDTKAEAVTGVTVSADKKTVSVKVPDLKPGRVYDFALNGVKSATGEAVLHPEAYYTLNELVK